MANPKPTDPTRTNVIDLPTGRFLPEPEDVKDWENLWCIPARDHRGHYEPVGFKMPPQLHDAMVKIYRSGMFPATDRSAFCRAAIKLLIDLCYKLRPELSDSNYMQYAAIQEVLKEERNEEEFEVLFQQMTGQVHKLIGRGDNEHARRLLYKILESIRAMPTGYRRNRYLTAMEELWGGQLAAYNIDWGWERQAPVGLGDLFCGQEKEEGGSE